MTVASTTLEWATALLSTGGMAAKTSVYVLKNDSEPPAYYTGLTSDLGARDERLAVAFEEYRKSGSGSAFAKHHLR